MPNVTAIDWKQADVFDPGFDHQGGMSSRFTETRAAFSFSCTARLTLGVVLKTIAKDLLPKRQADETPAA
ncbi:MAG TPA: hypothetical protein VFS76_08520 [Pyrinomonadaceae bacterium]|nr:hypothetical protein [Pyrinomonadaceae bacterium]